MPEIRDPLYGDIFISDMELAILDTREFQRLRWLFQLPLSHLVFPGATHTRFSHSIGVMELATRIANGIKGRNKIRQEQIENLRIAALLHDVDEPPFYPVFKEKYPRKQYAPNTRETVTRKICQQVSSKIDCSAVLSIMDGKDEYYFLSQIIDSEVGANRIDYLLRDSFYCGVKYGSIDLRILYEFEIKDNELILKREAIPLVDSVFNCLYQMKVNVYDHRVGRSALCMIFDLLERALKGRYKLEDLSRLTDEEFLRILTLLDKAAINKIYGRNLMKAAYCVDAYMLRDLKVSQYLESYRMKREEIEKEIGQISSAKVLIDFISLRAAPATSVKARMNGDYVELDKVPLLRKWYSEKPYEQWKLYVFCDEKERGIVSKVCNEIFGFLEVGREKEPRLKLPILSKFYEDMRYLEEQDLVAETKEKILMLPAHEQTTLKTLVKLGSGTAEDVGMEINKSRSTESIILNNLQKAGLTAKQKVKRRVIYTPTTIVITALRDLGLY